MENGSKDTLSKNIENRLDEFFNDSVLKEGSKPATPSLEKLKSMVLSIDWEITDECLDGLIAETDSLITVYQNDKPTFALLRMLKALANYIRKNKAQSHQEAIKRVMSVFKSLESIIEVHGNDEAQKMNIVATEIKAFNVLKVLIGQQRAVVKPTPAEVLTGAGKEKFEDIKDVKTAISTLETRINTQIEQLKNQLAVIKMELANFIEK